MSKSLERIVIIAGLALVVGLIGLTAYLGLQSMQRANEEAAAGATTVAKLAPTWTAAAKPAIAPTVAPAKPAATPSPTPATPVPATAAASPRPTDPPAATKPVVSPTIAASGATATPDLSGPGLAPEPDPALEAQRKVVATVGDGGLGDKAARLLTDFYPLVTRAYAENKPELLQPFMDDEAYAGYVRSIGRANGEAEVGVPVIAYRVQPTILSNFDDGSYAVNVAEIQYFRNLDPVTRQVVRVSKPYRECARWFLTEAGGTLKIGGGTTLPERFCSAGWPDMPTPTKG
jgi:hypothetical protein